MKRPRTIITRVIVFLLLGAIVNVAVAWGLAWRGLSIENLREKQLDLGLCQPVHNPDWLPPDGTVYRVSEEGFGVCIVAWWPTTLLDGTRSDRQSASAKTGYPNYCFQGSAPDEVLGMGTDRRRLKAIWIQSLTDPIVAGFAINTIFYAAILWLLFFAPGSVRRTFRRRRGLCPACAYPVGTSPVCTECGKAVTRGDAGSDERTRSDTAR